MAAASSGSDGEFLLSISVCCSQTYATGFEQALQNTPTQALV
jgi:hypothetical protein